MQQINDMQFGEPSTQNPNFRPRRNRMLTIQPGHGLQNPDMIDLATHGGSLEP